MAYVPRIALATQVQTALVFFFDLFYSWIMLRLRSGLTMLLVTLAGCRALMDMHEGPPSKPTAVTLSSGSAPSTSFASTNDTVHVPMSSARAREPVAVERAPDPNRRCWAYQKREAPAGALAWISECFIKIAKPIHFQFNSDVIHVESESILQAVANVLHEDLSLHIEIGAHTDGRGSRQYNMELAQKRADAVKVFLVGKGIDAERLVARGFGDEQPISHPPEVEGRRTNRRIEFVILPE